LQGTCTSSKSVTQTCAIGLSDRYSLRSSASSSSSSSQSSSSTLCLTAYPSRDPPVLLLLLPGSLCLAPVLGGPPAAAAAEAVPGSGFTRAELGPGVTAGIELDAVLPALVDCINTRFGWSALMGANAEASFLKSHVVHQTTMCMHVVEGQLAVSWMLPCQLESADCVGGPRLEAMCCS